MPQETGGSVVIKANTIGDYGDSWSTTESSGNKVAAVDPANSADIYIAYEDGVQSFKMENPVIPLGEAPTKIKFSINHNTNQTEGLHLVCRLKLATGQEAELIYDSNTTVKTDEFETYQAPDGEGWAQEKLDGLQVIVESEGLFEPLTKVHESWVVHWLKIEVFHDVA